MKDFRLKEGFVIIPNVSMPRRCVDCPMDVDAYECQLLDIRFKDAVDPYEERLPSCPLIEIKFNFGGGGLG